MKKLLLLLLLLIPITIHAQGAGTAASIYRTPFANLGTPRDGSVRYVTDGTPNTSPCTGSGTGAFAQRTNGVWVCGSATVVPAGTVTSVSVVTANGVSGSVANPTTTPAITLTLGAITPSSVTSAGLIQTTGADGSQLEIKGTGITDFKMSVGASGYYVYDVTNSKTPLTLSPNTNNNITVGTSTVAITGSTTLNGASPNALFKLWSHHATNSNFALFDSNAVFSHEGATIESVSDDGGTLKTLDFNISGAIFHNGGSSAPISAGEITTSATSSTGTAVILDGSSVLRPLTSSLRFKKNVREWHPSATQMSKFLSLKPIIWDYKDDGAKDVVGFSAEGLATVDRELVNLDAEGKPYSNREHAMLAYLQEIAQKQQRKLDRLTAQVAAQQRMISRLKHRR